MKNNYALKTSLNVQDAILMSIGRLQTQERYIRLYPDKISQLTDNDICVSRIDDINNLYIRIADAKYNETSNEVSIELNNEEYMLLIQAFEYLDMLLPTDIKYAYDEEDAKNILKASEINKQIKQYIVENVQVF